MDSGIDEARIASVVALACRISRSWDLGRPLHSEVIAAGEVIATEQSVTVTAAPAIDSSPDDVVANPIRRLCSKSSPPSGKETQGANRYLVLLRSLNGIWFTSSHNPAFIYDLGLDCECLFKYC